MSVWQGNPKRLVDIDQTQGWLIEKMRQGTGKYFDSWYLQCVFVRNMATSGMVANICKSLNLSLLKE